MNPAPAPDRGVLPLLPAVGSAACGLALLATSGWLITRAAEHPPVLYLLVAVVAVRAFGLFRGVLRYLERLSGHRLALQRQSRLRVEVWTAMTGQSWIGRRGGDLLARVVSDVAAVQDRVVRVRLPIAGAALTAGLAVSATALIVPAAGAWLLAGVLLGGGVLPWVGARIGAAGERAVVRCRAELAAIGAETASAADELAVFDATGSLLGRVGDLDRRVRRAESWRAAGTAVGSAGLWVGTATSTLGLLGVGSAAAASGRIDGPWFAVLALVPLGVHEVLAGVPSAWLTRARVAASLARVEAITGAGLALAGPGLVVGPRGSLRARGLAVGWSGEPVVTGLDLDVAPGDRVAVTGPSGVGKSTLAATILGLVPPVAGTLTVGGPVGYLAQDAHLFDTTVAENLRIGRRDATDAEIAAVLRRVGVDLPPDRLVGQHGVRVSGGEARRIALARLLLRDDPLLIMDEPTDQLDAPTACDLLAVIDEVTRGRTVIMIGHDPALTAWCDRAVSLAPYRLAVAERPDWPGGPGGETRALPSTLVAADR